MNQAYKKGICLSLLLLFAGSPFISAQDTKSIYLSGTGFDQSVEWEFYCSDGMNSGAWTSIEVPSCWEQQGFGQYNYGHDAFEERLKEEGHYRYFFDLEKGLKGQSIHIVFDGVMTDARVLVNGKQAGEVHQGAFNPFSYDISKLIKYGRENKLEVFVKKFSDNMTVNHAERKADYWIFGGIYRPVYLEVKPAEHIIRVAVDARADGTFTSHVYTSGLKQSSQLEVGILDPAGSEVATFKGAVSGNEGKHTLSGTMKEPLSWTPEDPNLYTAEFRLLNDAGEAIHNLSEKIGFRTVEVKAQDGIYVNDVRIKYKGVCRHTFHPDHGRTSSKAFSIEVVNLLKDMNMNAVRMSHYAPDSHFLDVCDSLGLFVLNELAGWQAPSYDSVVGRKLLKEMIASDVNHPSIIMWDNANEGGWNTVYDKDFKELDIQEREVNHPWAVHELTNTAHYVNYDYLSMDHFAPREIFFPTELLHGLYDGGHGAGLEDYWLRMWEHPLCAGGFLWVFADEAVRRSDTGELDSDGNHAPDGILGPYHEKEGSFYAIREIWSPVHFEKRYITPEFNGRFRIQNRFHYTNLDQCTFSYQWLDLPGPWGPENTGLELMASGVLLKEGAPSVDHLAPGQSGTLTVPLYEGWRQADVLCMEARDPMGRMINRWSWPVKSPELSASESLETDVSIQVMVSVSETDQLLILESSGVSLKISKRNGRLANVHVRERELPLSDGPVFTQDTLKLIELKHFSQGGSHHVRAVYENGSALKWTMHPSGLVDMRLSYQPGSEFLNKRGGTIPYTGASFTYPEEEIKYVKYMGKGPYRVWKNRRAGVNFNVWDKPYNNTITGHSGFVYPEFKGYYSDLYWVTVKDRKDQKFTVYSKTDDLFLKLFTPQEAPVPANTALEHPPGDLSFMLGIPPIGTKFAQAYNIGPQSRGYQYLSKRLKDGALLIELTFDFTSKD